MNIVVDTDVWVAGVRGSGHANGVLRLCLEGRLIPLMGAALLAEYEDLLDRESIWRKARLMTAEREAFLDPDPGSPRSAARGSPDRRRRPCGPRR